MNKIAKLVLKRILKSVIKAEQASEEMESKILVMFAEPALAFINISDIKDKPAHDEAIEQFIKTEFAAFLQRLQKIYAEQSARNKAAQSELLNLSSKSENGSEKQSA